MNKKNRTPDKDSRAWHSLSPEAACAELGSTEQGLSSQEAKLRLAQYGSNKLTAVVGRSTLKRFLSQFHNVLIYVLIAAAGVTAALEEWVDSGVIVSVVVVNALIGFIQEGKAEKALDAIRNMLTQQAMVWRDGKNVLMPAGQLVPGDIVTVESGDKVPADLRLLQVKNLRVDESMLTGESMPVEKKIAVADANAPLGDRFCLAYSGTLVTYGTGLGIVVGTGDKTEIGRISSMLRTVPQLTTPLLKQIAGFSTWLTLAILTVASATFAYGWTIQHASLTELFMSVVGVAVAAIPEGLPAIMTITLAIGVQRMAKRNAIIRRLPAVETLGSVTIICSDKTGTLTCNEMTAKSVFVNNKLFTVEGVGYDPYGDFQLAGETTAAKDHPHLHELIRAAALCNNARLEHKSGNWIVHGDPTEGALITLAHKAGMDTDTLNQDMPRTDTIPFESEHRYMATLHHDRGGHAFIFIKGAPEQVLGMCGLQRINGEDSPIHAADWRQMMETIAGQGQRLLAVAFKTAPPTQKQIKHADVETGLTLLGVVGMIDPPRPEAIQAVRKCQNAGIRVKMITGDHAATAAAIAAQINIGDGQVLSGEKLDRMSDSELKEAIGTIDVFARTSPENKLRLVTALQANGHVVAMTGDGVNDAPALKQADVGVAMGRKGTEAAKQAGAIVLADDNFASIAHAVEEGRTVYDNLRKTITFLLPINGGESLSLLAAVLLGLALPIAPVQILWVNMVSSIALAMVLAFEPTEADVMRRAPRPPREPMLTRFVVWRIVLVSSLFLAGIFASYQWALAGGADVATARTLAVNSLVAMEVFYLFSVRYLKAPSFTLQGVQGTPRVLVAVAAVLGLQALFTYAPFMQTLFGTRALGPWELALAAAAGVAVLLVLELEKALLRRLGRAA